MEDCKHEERIYNLNVYICLDCGKELYNILNFDKDSKTYHRSNINPLTQYRKSLDKTIHDELLSYGFNDIELIQTANEIYDTVVTKTKRGKPRKAMLFASVFCAYSKLGKPRSSESLQKIFNIEQKECSCGLKEVKLNVSKDIASLIEPSYITPIHLIHEIIDMSFVASDEDKDHIIRLYQLIQNKSSILNRARPKSVASGLIYYFIIERNKSIQLKTFCKKIKLSELTVNKMLKEIRNILKSTSIK